MPARDTTLRVEYPAPFLGFRIMVENNLRYRLNEKQYYLMQGQVNFIVAPNVESELYLSKGQVYQVFDLQIDAQLLQRLSNNDEINQLLNKVGDSQTWSLQDGPGFASARALDCMTDLVDNPGNETYAIDLIEQVIEARTMKRQHRQVTERQVESLFRVRALIKEQIVLKQHLRDWARIAGMNITYFKEMFKAVFGITPYHYLLYERIREAKRVMKFYPHLTLSEVATACGFSNYNNMRRAFVVMETMTLSKWQRLSDITGIVMLLELFQ